VVEASHNPAANLLLVLIGDARDTTTLLATVETVQRLLTGSVLATPSRDLLVGWLVNSSTGPRADRTAAGTVIGIAA
jgi:hypothetical protein